MDSADVCFVCMDDINRVPYIATYIEWLDVPFDIIYWSRSGKSESIGAHNEYRYDFFVEAGRDGSHKFRKLLGYIGFRNFAKRLLSKANYKLVIALTGNVAVLLSDVLLNRYEGKYVIDIRDYWHEDFLPYHNREQLLINNSALPVISSPAYKEFLGDHDFAVMHNDQLLDDEDIASVFACAKKPGDPYVLACVGAMKNPDYDKKVIDLFGNDDRFELRFIGRGYDSLQEYCDAKSIHNVVTKGSFSMSETLVQYRGVDAVLNMYGNGSPYWDYALSNKLYFAARLHLPIVVCPDTAMELYSQQYHFGCSAFVDDPSSKQNVIDMLQPENRSKVVAGCKAFLDYVEEDNAQTRQRVVSLLA